MLIINDPNRAKNIGLNFIENISFNEFDLPLDEKLFEAVVIAFNNFVRIMKDSTDIDFGKKTVKNKYTKIKYNKEPIINMIYNIAYRAFENREFKYDIEEDAFKGSFFLQYFSPMMAMILLSHGYSQKEIEQIQANNNRQWRKSHPGKGKSARKMFDELYIRFLDSGNKNLRSFFFNYFKGEGEEILMAIWTKKNMTYSQSKKIKFKDFYYEMYLNQKNSDSLYEFNKYYSNKLNNTFLNRARTLLNDKTITKKEILSSHSKKEELKNELIKAIKNRKEKHHY